MAGQQRQAVVQPQTEATGCLPILLRMFWMMFGFVGLLILAAFVAKGTAPVVMDVAYFAVASGIIAVRYVDIAKFKGQTAEGKPATLADWRRYALMMAVISGGLWAVARFAASRGWM
jgi:hypothetical protein